MDAERLNDIGAELEAAGKRIDHDLPTADDAYLIKVETGDGRRLMARVTKQDLALTEDPRRLLLLKAAGLFEVFMIQDAQPKPRAQDPAS